MTPDPMVQRGSLAPSASTLTALLDASYRLSRTTTTAQAADVFAETARTLRGADGAHLYLPDTLGGRVWSNVNEGPGSAARGTLSLVVAEDAPDVETCLAQGEEEFVVDALAPDGPRRALRTRYGMSSLLYVPILDIGVLVLWWHEQRPAPPVFDGDWPAFVAHGGQALRRRLEATTLRDLSTTDPLTGLTNRRSLVQALAALPAGGSLLLLDLDHFKRVNDTLGHRHGDLVLQAFAALLRTVCLTASCVARYGGEEFAVVFPTHGRNRGIVAYDELRQAWAAEGRHVSAGLSVHRKDATAEETLEAADRALYEAKRTGRDRLVQAADVAWTGSDVPVIQGPATPVRAPSTTMSLHDLDAALGRGLVVPHFQPVVDTRTGVVASVEALARLRHPGTGALLHPADFLPLAERTGRVRHVDRQVSAAAIAAAAHWRQGAADVSVAVNVSVDHLDDGTLVSGLLAQCAEQGLPPSALVVEMTETLRSVTGRGHERAIRQLRDAGVNVLLDDFGTGFSALSYLLRFPVSGIKIDRSFTAALHTDLGRRLTAGVIDLALSMGLDVVAEGVETPQQLAWLTDHGCPHVQGYLFSRPVPVSELADVVRMVERARNTLVS